MKVAAEVAHPHLVKQGYRRKQQRHKEEVQKRIEKAEKWGDDVCEASIPELAAAARGLRGPAAVRRPAALHPHPHPHPHPVTLTVTLTVTRTLTRCIGQQHYTSATNTCEPPQC